MARTHVGEWVTCSSFRCEKVKADLVTILLGKEGGEARGGVSTGFGAGRSSVYPGMQSPGCGTLLNARNEPMRQTVSKFLSFKVHGQAGRKREDMTFRKSNYFNEIHTIYGIDK